MTFTNLNRLLQETEYILLQYNAACDCPLCEDIRDLLREIKRDGMVYEGSSK